MFYDPTIPLLGIYLEKAIIKKDTCTPIFTAALFTIARTWKQPSCLPTIKDVCVCVYIHTYITYNGILLSHKKRTKLCHLQRHGWIQRLSSYRVVQVRKRKTNIVY